nr:MAG TPA: hypothetical protein [Caudoviricetes sp.]
MAVLFICSEELTYSVTSKMKGKNKKPWQTV